MIENILLDRIEEIKNRFKSEPSNESFLGVETIKLTAVIVLENEASLSVLAEWRRLEKYPSGSTGAADTRFYFFPLGRDYSLAVEWMNFRLDATNTIQAIIYDIQKKPLVSEAYSALIVQDNEHGVERSLSYIEETIREKVRQVVLTLHSKLRYRFG